MQFLETGFMGAAVLSAMKQLMKKYFGSTFVHSVLMMGLLLVSVTGFSQEKIKIGYVGNSITAANHNRYWFPLEFEAYSDISGLLINQYFGEIADVQNFGDGGKTMVDKIEPSTGVPYTDSYMQQRSFQDALEFAPDILFISLGTNDGRTDFWPDTEGSRRFVLDFYEDYMNMIDSFKLVNPDTYFILGYPPPIFGTTTFNLWVESMELNVRPEIDKVIDSTGCDSIDWHELLLDAGPLFPDNLHPDKEGSALMGRFAFEKILNAGLLDTFMCKTNLALGQPVSVSSFIDGHPAEFATDIDPQTYWEAGFSGSESVSVDLGLDYDINIVRLVWNDNSSRDYEVQVSADSANWYPVVTVYGDTLMKNLHLNVGCHGRYFRMVLNNTDAASVALKEFELFGSLHMTGEDITGSGGVASAQYASPSGEGPEYAFDNVISTKFLSQHKEVWLKYAAPSYYRLNGYTVTAGKDGSDRDPVKWTLEASKDNQSWIALDSVGYDREISFSIRHEKKYFLVNDTTSYAFFRIKLTGSTSIVHIGEMELFGSHVSDLPQHNVSLSNEPSGLNPVLSFSGTRLLSHEMKITAGKISEYNFTGWTGSGEDVALLSDPSALSATFLMPDRDVSYTANYAEIVSVESASLGNLKVFPNPATDYLFVSGVNDDAILTVFSISGIRLKSGSGLRIDISDLSNGLFILSVMAGESSAYSLFTKG